MKVFHSTLALGLITTPPQHIKLDLVNVLGDSGSHDKYKHIICYSSHEIPVLDIGMKGNGGCPQVDNMILYWSQNL